MESQAEEAAEAEAEEVAGLVWLARSPFATILSFKRKQNGTDIVARQGSQLYNFQMSQVKHFGTIRTGRSSLMPVGAMRVIKPIVAGEQFLGAERTQRHIPEKRRGTPEMIDCGLPPRLPLHPRCAGAPHLLISAETRFDIVSARQDFA